MQPGAPNPEPDSLSPRRVHQEVDRQSPIEYAHTVNSTRYPMKKASIAVLLLLVIILVSGIACQGMGEDLLSCTPQMCLYCGKYVEQQNTNNYIELRTGSVAYLNQGGIETRGTWYWVGTEEAVHIRWEGQASLWKMALYSNTLTDQNGSVWIK